MALKIVDDSHKYTTVKVAAVKGPGGAYHSYSIFAKPQKEGEEIRTLARLDFQDGPIKETGVNGVMDENLIAIVIDRLRGFQSGKYACAENRQSLWALELALGHLKERTNRREQGGVEGTHYTAAGDAGHKG